MGFISSFRTQTPVPDGAAARKNLPAHLLAIVQRLERFVTPDYQDLAAVYNAFPNPADRPAFVNLVASGVWQYVGAPYDVYAPVANPAMDTAVTRTSATPQVQTTGDIAGFTETRQVGQFDYPHTIQVSYRALFNASNEADKSQGYVRYTDQNGSDQRTAFDRLTGSGSVHGTFLIFNQGMKLGGTPTEVQGGIEKVSGTGVTSVTTDSRFTSLSYVVYPDLSSVGAET